MRRAFAWLLPLAFSGGGGGGDWDACSSKKRRVPSHKTRLNTNRSVRVRFVLDVSAFGVPFAAFVIRRSSAGGVMILSPLFFFGRFPCT